MCLCVGGAGGVLLCVEEDARRPDLLPGGSHEGGHLLFVLILILKPLKGEDKRLSAFANLSLFFVNNTFSLVSFFHSFNCDYIFDLFGGIFYPLY